MGKIRILVVETDQDARDMLVEYLTNMGAMAVGTNGLNQTMREFVRFQPDIAMANIGREYKFYGLGTIRKLSALGISVIAMTGNIGEGERVARAKAFAAGAVAFTSKPFRSLSDLWSLVQKVLREAMLTK